jgi:hypothetical protein
MLHVGEFPLMFKPSAGWREMRWDFSDATPGDGVNMQAMGIAGGEYPMPGAAGGYLMLKAAASCLTAPDSDQNKFQLYVDDDTTADGISVTITNTPRYVENHITDYTATVHECEDFIKGPYCTGVAGGTDAQDVIFSVWGYYYAA